MVEQKTQKWKSIRKRKSTLHPTIFVIPRIHNEIVKDLDAFLGGKKSARIQNKMKQLNSQFDIKNIPKLRSKHLDKDKYGIENDRLDPTEQSFKSAPHGSCVRVSVIYMFVFPLT